MEVDFWHGNADDFIYAFHFLMVYQCETAAYFALERCVCFFSRSDSAWNGFHSLPCSRHSDVSPRQLGIDN